MTGLWKTWMTAWCWGVILFGVILMGAAFPATDRVAHALLTLFGGVADPSVFDQREMRFAVGLMGAVTLGWGLTMLLLLPAMQLAGAPAWRALLLVMAIWYVVDGAISIMTGFWINAVSNTAFVIALVIPILASNVLKPAQ